MEFLDLVAYTLAHSGTVLLLQTTDLESSFLSRLVPWVHYVPISHNGADLLKKLNWLKTYDRSAYKIMENAKAFSESYLRLEDHYCYGIRLMHTIGTVLEGSDALRPFDAGEIDLSDIPVPTSSSSTSSAA